MIVENAKKTRQASSRNDDSPAGHGSAVRHACSVMRKPASPGAHHAPVTTRHRPVKEQMTMVSRNVPVMVTSPCRTGSSLLEQAAAIGVEPRPASFVKTPRPIPMRRMRRIVSPPAAPAAARGENAETAIRRSAAGICARQRTRMSTEQRTYTADISGTTSEHTREMRSAPPSSTMAENRTVRPPAMTAAQVTAFPPAVMATLRFSGSKKPSTAVVMLLTCATVPTPSRPTAAPTAANVMASQRQPSPCSM